MPKGGFRPNSGPKKGTKYGPNKGTISKEMAREALRVVVQQHMGRMVRSQVANAIGIGHLFTRDKTGKFSRIESEADIERLMTTGTQGEDYWIFAKDPSVAAFTDLMNRALDKPKEQEVEISIRGDDALVAALASARRRVSSPRPPEPETPETVVKVTH